VGSRKARALDKQLFENHMRKVRQELKHQLMIAGTPLDLKAPSDEERLMMLNLEAGAGQKRAAVWHVHVIKTSVAAVNAQTDWFVTLPLSQQYKC
jgi:hypothetical protein